MPEVIDTNSQPSPAGSHGRWKLPKLSRKRLGTAALVVVIVIAVVVVLIVNKKHNSSDPYTYTYKNPSQTSVKLLGAPKHAPNIPGLPVVPDVNLSFQKPPELQPIAGSSISDSANYRHQISGKTVAELNILMYSFGGSYGKITEPVIATALSKSPQTQDYKSAVAPLTAFTEDHLPGFNTLVYSLNIGPAQKLSTSHIKDKAWQFDVTLSKKTSAQPYVKASQIQSYKNWHGKLLYVWTGSHLYYVLLDSIQQNWQPNMSTWQQIIDSLQLS
jgi:hypothetical protein